MTMDHMSDDCGGALAAEAQARPADFLLQKFFPYLARAFYSRVSGSVSQLYEDQYGMKRYEWRTMAILGQSRPMTASEIVAASSMDKVSVSRAITALRKRGWIVEAVNKSDARSRLLKLSVAGRKVFDTLVPQMIALERKLLADLSEDEIETLKALMSRVANAAGDVRRG